MEKHPLNEKLPNLQQEPEVEKAVKKKERLSGEKIPNDPNERLETYIQRLEKIFLNEDERVKERNLELLKPKLYENLIIKREDVPESYFELQKQIAREQGHGDIEITNEMREQMIDTIIDDQTKSLDNIIEYLTSEDAMYPAWFKYFAFTNLTKLSQFDKERGKFKKRTNNTVAPFPDIYREPLAQICDLYEEIQSDRSKLKDPQIQKQFSQSFPKFYAEKIQESLASKIENKEGIAGEWIKYEQGNSEHSQKLYDSLQGKGTGWCTAGLSTAKTQIESGDFYVYYTYDDNNDPTQPRIAIRMNGQNEIAEVRGILQHQAMESQFSDILDEKLDTFGKDQAEKYKKKTEDMRRLTEIDKKQKAGEELTGEDLRFTYEIDSKIEGFGYEDDPRIKEILETRNPNEDLSIIFDCTPDQIATNKNEVSKNTKVYNGPLYPNIFNELPETIEKIYTNFPERISEVYIKEITIPNESKTAEQYQEQLERDGHKTSDWSKDILLKAGLEQGRGKKIKLIIVSNESLGLKSGATRAESKARAIELGIASQTLPAIVGLELRMQYTDQPKGEYILIDMESIRGRDGYPLVFSVYRDGSDSWLRAVYGRPGVRWGAGYRWAFSQI